tara:strand:+ start:918 stop:1733 length:816 start_codon:yes stop_codon:yes gene_type:complete
MTLENITDIEMATTTNAIAIDPEQATQEATNWAKSLMKVVDSAIDDKGKPTMYVNLKGNKYLKVEAWELIGKFAGVSAQTKSVTAVSEHDEWQGYEAHVILVDKNTGQPVGGGAMAYCGKDENVAQGQHSQGGKRNAVMSMAQTRATSKAFRLNFAFVAQLGGYESLPSDEITDEMQGIPKPKQEVITPTPQYQGATTIEHKDVEADIPVQVKQVSEENKDQPPSERQLKWIDQFIDKGLVVRDTVYDTNGDPIITKQEASNLITLNGDIK